MLSSQQAVDLVRMMVGYRDAERDRLDRLHAYVRDLQPLWWIPAGAPHEVKQIAKAARVNVLGFVVDAVAQGLYVDGYRSDRPDPDPAWLLWQANRLDSGQVGVHRAGATYGAAYATVLPGVPWPVVRGVSPRKMTVVYGSDDLWPQYALESKRTDDGELWRLFDEDHSYWVGEERRSDFGERQLSFVGSEEHGSGVVPVVRFLPEVDLDGDVVGSVEPLLHLQDQINLTTFGMLVAQHYGAFRQRYILGWLAETEQQKLQASAAKLWTFEDEGVKVGEFEQTDLSGFIESREASLRHLATVSQTPVHELLGTLANLSAEALVAARHTADRKAGVHEVSYGESWEQTLELAVQQSGGVQDPSAAVRWKDTTARSLAQVADALGKIAVQLHVPPQALWEMIPGMDDQKLQRWKDLYAEQDAFAGLRDVMDRIG
jgi:hypothetical protein